MIQPTCTEVRRALDRARDGVAPLPPAESDHAASCAACLAYESLQDSIGARLRERGGPAIGAPDADLRHAVLARIRRGDAAALELRPFLLRAAFAAAVVVMVASSISLWKDRSRSDERPGDASFLAREDILADVVRPALGGRR
jgi:hypothetical protein